MTNYKHIKSKIVFYLSLIFLFVPAVLFAQLTVCTIKSPNKQVRVDIMLRNGNLVYNIKNKGVVVLANSRLGINLSKANLSENLKITEAFPQKRISDNYSLISGKRLQCSYTANEQILRVENVNEDIMNLIFRVSNDGVAFRYNIVKICNPDKMYSINNELTSFNFEKSSKAWLHPRQEGGTGWCRTQPSFEENYEQEVVVGTKSSYNEGWTFPSLFKTKNAWVLLSETDLSDNYCGTHLSGNVIGSEYFLALADSAEDINKNGSKQRSNLSWLTPWRLIFIGSDLGKIVESTLSTDLASPSKIGECSFVKPGISSWSWALLNDPATMYATQKDFIDYASSMKWSYCLIDALWDVQIGEDQIKELAEYANSKNIGLWLWYNSAGNWNDTPQTPKDKLVDSNIRKTEFEKLQKLGIKGIKVDFFSGEGQSTMKYQQDILKDAATYHLMVNFHGSTFPRGWTRTYPNLMTTEAVKGFEYRTFSQLNEDVVASHCCMLPFTRNVVAPMDFTPLCFSEIRNIQRKTSNAFELALSILFESGIQHFVEIPSGMDKVPDYVREFLKNIPNAWDDIKFIDGYPGRYVVLARKKNSKWYIAGINGTEKTLSLIIDISFLKQKKVNLITDGANNRTFLAKKISTKKRLLNIKIKPCGGFIIN